MIKLTSPGLLTALFLTAIFLSCQKDEAEFSQPRTNSTPKKDAALGRVLFYDKQLSVNGSVSCASCHKQQLAFADDAALSKGYDNRLTTRNSIAIQNLQVLAKDFGIPFVPPRLFWDGRESELEKMVLRPLAHHIEMGITDIDKLAEKLAGISYYPELFNNTFGPGPITGEKIGYALADFVSSIISHDSKFDRNLRLSALEEYGQFLFETKYPCNSCHRIDDPSGYLFGGTDNSPFANIGLNVIYSDNGVADVSGKEEDKGLFKIPSLRNVAVTGPYMHDGRFSTLDEVLDHYSIGMAAHPNLDERLKDSKGMPLVMNITTEEKTALVAFLETFTDNMMLTNSTLSDPFRY